MIRLLLETVPEEGTLELGVRESRYLAKVRRAAEAERLLLMDRAGHRVEAVIESLEQGRVTVRILGPMAAAPAPVPIHLLVSTPKRNLLDDVVRGVSELGAQRLTPVLAGRSVMLPGDGRIERWRRIADESMRQCGRRSPLEVDHPVPLPQALCLADQRSTRLLLHPHLAAVPMARILSFGAATPWTGGPVTLAVGPEGGFEDREIEAAREHGFVLVSLGDSILRIETAALGATAVVVASFASIHQAR